MEINEQYINYDIINLIGSTIKKDHVIQLQQFIKNTSEKNNLSRIIYHKNKKEKVDDMMTGTYDKSDIKIDVNALKTVLSKILDKKIHKIKFELRTLKWKDYTILNDKEKKQPIIIIDITSEWSPEYGGQMIFTDGKEKNIIIDHKKYSAIISDGVMLNFIKYINHKAKNKKLHILYGVIR